LAEVADVTNDASLANDDDSEVLNADSNKSLNGISRSDIFVLCYGNTSTKTRKENCSSKALWIDNRCTMTIRSQEHPKISNYEQTQKMATTVVPFDSQD
jgi:hypothetical protein